MTNPMQKEFEIFAKTSQKDDGMIDSTAAVCTVLIDKGETTITKIFLAKKKNDFRAEDLVLEWLFVEPNVQSANRLEIKIFLNYSPLETTSLAIVDKLKLFETQGKRVNMSIRFVALHGQGDDEDKDEHKGGLQSLQKARVKLGLFDEADWLYLLNILKDPTWIKKQLKGTRSSRQALRGILQDVDDDDIYEREDISKASGEVTEKVME